MRFSALARLKSWTAGGTTTDYGWDASGNRIKNGTKTAVFDARNQLQSDGDYTYTYSPRGTLASRTSSGLTEPFSYDAFDRLANANGTTYSYDGLDRIAARGSQQFAYAGLDSDPASDGTATYARDPGGAPIAVSEGQNKQLTLSDQHGDVVGSFNSTDTALAGLTASAAFDPFGHVVAETTGGTPGNIGYQGDWTDPASDQVKMGARWYNPGTGAFNSRDDWTLEPEPSVQANDYTYANGDPLDNTDPTGHYCWVCVIPETGLEGVAGASTAAGLGFGWLGLGAVGMYYIWRPSPTVDDSYPFDPYYPGFGVTHGCLCGQGVSPGGGHHGRPSYGGGGFSGSPGLTAAQRAEAARQALLARLRAITAAARHHADWAAKHKRLPAPTAAGKPLFSNKKSIISTNPHLPAKRVGVSRDVVADQNAATQAIYHQALEDAGPVIHDISIAVQVAPEDTSRAEPGSSIVGAPNDPGPRVTTVATPASGDGVFGLPTTEDEEDRCTPYKHNDPLDGIGRAQGGSARYCSESDLEGGSEANDQIFPPGFPEPDENGLSTNPMLGSNRMYDRCHIIGRQLGGDGDDEQNLFTCLHTVNTPTMRRLENQVKRAVKARQQVDYRVTLIYRRRSRVMPSAIHIVAHGTGPGGFPGLSIDKCLENNMQGRVLDGDAC
jgi:RHS repeat-associated protein